MPQEPEAQHDLKDSSRICILVVDDDAQLQRMIIGYLQTNDIQAIGAFNREATQRLLAQHDVALVILDLRLGAENGLDLLREIRSVGDVPIIIVTGHRRHEIDRVVGLELGADDYLTKPFGMSELLARIRAVLRRTDASRVALRAREANVRLYRFGGWLLNAASQQLTDPAGETINLTKGEYALLLAFLKAPQQTLSRERLLQSTRLHEDVFDRSIDVQILRLRRKLEEDASTPQIIQTRRGAGYVFLPSVQVA